MRNWPLIILPAVAFAAAPLVSLPATTLAPPVQSGVRTQAVERTAPATLAFGSGAAPQASPSLREAYARSTASAVRVNIGRSGIGSGFFISSDGLVLTAAHVALGEPGAAITVTTDDGVRHAARIVGYDESRDLAVLRVQGKGFTPLKFASRAPAVGDAVVAIGNSRGAFDGGRAGRVTAVNASLDASFPSGLVASTMPLAPGDSGGPVLNARGEVVGVSTAVSEHGGVFRSYFVPLTQGSRVVQELRSGVKRGVPVIGIGVADARDFARVAGALVTDVTRGLGGAKAGLRVPTVREFRDESGRVSREVTSADVIVSVDGRKVTRAADLVAYVRTRKAGDRVKLGVQRGGKTVTVTVTLSHRRAA